MTTRYLNPNDPVAERFTSLPIGEVAELPIDALTPTTIDDLTSSHTSGPIEAYALRVRSDAVAERIGQVAIWIADGNHRYFQQLREGRRTVTVKKIIPDREHDIRFIFKAADRWDEM